MGDNQKPIFGPQLAIGRRNMQRFAWLAAGPFTLLLLIASLQPWFQIAPPFDKAIHVAAYFCFAAVVLAATGVRRILLTTSAVILFAAVCEGLQFFTGRTPSLADLIASAIGAGAGAAVTAIVLTARQSN